VEHGAFENLEHAGVSRILKNDGALASENDGKTQGSAARINLMVFFKAWAGRLE
jgi:hypothetical protein